MLTNLPNILTLSRIGVIPILALVIYVNQPATRWIALFLFTLAGVTDYFDGYLARNRGQVSALGRFLDPIADKLLVAAVLLMLVGVVLSAMIWRLQAYLLRWQRQRSTE